MYEKKKKDKDFTNVLEFPQLVILKIWSLQINTRRTFWRFFLFVLVILSNPTNFPFASEKYASIFPKFSKYSEVPDFTKMLGNFPNNPNIKRVSCFLLLFLYFFKLLWDLKFWNQPNWVLCIFYIFQLETNGT